MSKKFYVIWKGAKTGIFSTWVEVQNYTQGRSDAQFMGFPSKAEAEAAFASTYTKALMKRSLANKGAASNKVKATSGRSHLRVIIIFQLMVYLTQQLKYKYTVMVLVHQTQENQALVSQFINKVK